MFIAKRDPQRSYMFFFVQLLRLRQCTSHYFMMEQVIKESWTLEDVEEACRKLNAIKRRSDSPF